METEEHGAFSPTAQEHAAAPRNYGPLEDYNGNARITGPCGDTMEFWVAVWNGLVEDASFTTTGCGSSLAAGSMTTCLARGRALDTVMGIEQEHVLAALGGLPEAARHCALLAANTLRAACEDYLAWAKSRGIALEPPTTKEND